MRYARILLTGASIPGRGEDLSDRRMDLYRDHPVGIVHCRPSNARAPELMLPFIATADLTHHRLVADQDTGCAATVQRVAPPLWTSRPESRRKKPSRLLCLFPAAVLLSMLGSTHSPAETLGDARVGFTAERVLVLDGRRYVGRMWHMPGEQRGREGSVGGKKKIFPLPRATPR